jgi:hypothetical protein
MPPHFLEQRPQACGLTHEAIGPVSQALFDQPLMSNPVNAITVVLVPSSIRWTD